MRKIFLFMMLTTDGKFEGVDHDISWHNTDEEFDTFANQQLDEVDTILMGRRTYELMESFWPTEEAKSIEPETAMLMSTIDKHVFTHNKLETNWKNVEVHDGNVGEIVKALKEKPGKDITVLGSSNLCLTLIREGLLDEIRLMINPVILGSGSTLFQGMDTLLPLSLKTTRTFGNGNILLTYSVG